MIPAALWAWLCWIGAVQQGWPDIPDTTITYLGSAAAPAFGIDGLAAVPPAAATALLFSGGFGFGSDAILEAALAAAPHVRLVAFDSPGGRPAIADAVAQSIWSRHLNTHVERTCASACTVAFVAGTVRSASVKARFAFHRASAWVLDDLTNILFARIERLWFVRGGVSLSFLNRAAHAPNATAYMPPLGELVAAGYLHRLVGKPAQPGPQPAPEAVFAEMRRVEPQTALILLAADRLRVKSGVSAERSRAMALNEAALVVNRWLSRSSDTAILALVDATLAVLAALDPVSCMRWQVSIRDQDTGALAIPPALRARLLAAQGQILRDANAYPTPLPAQSHADADGAVRSVISAAYGPQALSNASTPEHAFDDPAKSCAVSAAYLRGLRDRPEGPGVLRWALAAG